jgi:hypothetical protein
MLAQPLPTYWGEVNCQGQLKNGRACSNKAYYTQAGLLLCGVHSKEKKRNQLPKDPYAEQRRQEELARHAQTVENRAAQRQNAREPGRVECYQMRMLKEVPLREGWLNVFPNNKHQNRCDGLGCCTLSPMRLGPVEHRQPGLPPALNIENYHQFNKVWPCEVVDDDTGTPKPEFFQLQLQAYRDPEPHRHKFDAETMSRQRAAVQGLNRNAPLYSLHLDLQGQPRRFSYVESRYFYCCAYEALASARPEFALLQQKLAQGYDLLICGYDARETGEPFAMYCDPTKPFGHELVLWCLLTLQPGDYPWHRYRAAHPAVYDDIAHVVTDVK